MAATVRRWAWFALVAFGMFWFAWMFRYERIHASTDDISILTFWDRWTHRPCHVSTSDPSC